MSLVGLNAWHSLIMELSYGVVPLSEMLEEPALMLASNETVSHKQKGDQLN